MEAIGWLVDQNVDAICVSISFSFLPSTTEKNLLVYLKNAKEKNIPIFISGGNVKVSSVMQRKISRSELLQHRLPLNFPARLQEYVHLVGSKNALENVDSVFSKPQSQIIRTHGEGVVSYLAQKITSTKNFFGCKKNFSL